MSEKKNIIDKALIVGSSVAVNLVLFEAAGFWHSGGEVRHLAASLVFALAVGALLIVLIRKSLHVWLAGFFLGIVIGVGQSFQLWLGESFEGEFFVALATMMFFAALGLIVGAAAEFIRLLHFIAHGGNIRNYPGQPAGDKPPASKPPL